MPEHLTREISDDIEAVVLVGGKGTRLKSVVSDRPKPMAEIAGKPFLEWILLGLQERGVTRVVLCSGYMPEFIEDYFGDGTDLEMQVSYSVDPYPLGTGGAVLRALEQVSSTPFLVLNGDSYCDFDIEYLKGMHQNSKASVTIWTTEVEDAHRFGSMDLAMDNSVTAFHEKRATLGPGVVNAGIYLRERAVVNDIPTGRAVSLETEVFPGLVGNGLYFARGDAPFLDIGTPESFAMAEEFLATARQHKAINVER